MSSLDRDRTRAWSELRAWSHAGRGDREFRRAAWRALRTLVPADAYWWATADPSTLLFTDAVTFEIPRAAGDRFLANELDGRDVNTFASLAGGPEHVRSLYGATEGRLERSARYRDILRPLAMGDELRAALLDGSQCWGFLCLHRAAPSRPFSATERARLSRLARPLAIALRNAQALEPADGSTARESGVVLVSRRLERVSATPMAEAWLADLPGEGAREALPLVVCSVAGRLLARERHDPPTSPAPRARVRTSSGRWLDVRASRMSGDAHAGTIAVILEPLRPPATAPLAFALHGLSSRERAVATCILRGLSTKEAAGELAIAPLTVQQHLKRVFDKFSVHSRGELIAKLLRHSGTPA